jgi:predicted PurR-regulated permease PerM
MLTINLIIIGIFLIILIIIMWGLINLIKKYRNLEKKYIDFYNSIYKKLKEIDDTRKNIDKENYFEYDENMQYIYTILDKLLNSLNNEFNKQISE